MAWLSKAVAAFIRTDSGTFRCDERQTFLS